MELQEFAETVWWPLKRGKLAPSTLAGYESDYRNLVLPRWGSVDMADIRASDIEVWLAPMSHGQAVNAIGALRRILRKAEAKDEIAVDPTRKEIEMPRERSIYRPKVLETHEVVELLRGFWSHPLEALVTVELLGGLRRCEACALYWSDIDLREGVITVDKGYQTVGGEQVEWLTKTKFSVREQAIPMVAVRRLREIKGKGPLAPDEKGERMNPDRVARRYRAHCERNALPYVPMTNLRHSWARMAMATGEIPETVARQLLGHSEKSQMLEQNYFRSNRSIAKGAAKAIEKLLVE